MSEDAPSQVPATSQPQASKSSLSFEEEIRSLPKEAALQRLKEKYLSDPRPSMQAKAHSPEGLSNIYYSIVTGET